MTGDVDDQSYALPRSAVSEQLEQWRDSFTVQMAKDKCRSTGSSTAFTVAVLGSGGCVDTLTAIRAGWTPVWGTEICPTHPTSPAMCSHFKRNERCQDNSQQKMWVDLTDTPCLGNTFSDTSKYNNIVRPVHISAGQPCTDYCLGRAQEGSDGPTGWMYTEQCHIILSILPLTFRLEMSDHALTVNGGSEVRQIKQTLEEQYFIFRDVQSVWGYGDGSHRKRLFIVGFFRVRGMEEALQSFEFPKPLFGDDSNHTARDWAVLDAEVPRDCWRKDNSIRVQHNQPANGEIHYLASAGKGIGPPDNPNQLTSWDFTAPGPTTLNGNNRRPRLDWIDMGNNPIGPSRVTTPVEVPRMGSFPWDYRMWVSNFDSSNQFLWRCVHNGVPVCTAYYLELTIKNTLQRWFNCRSDSIGKTVKLIPEVQQMIHQALNLQMMPPNNLKTHRLCNLATSWKSIFGDMIHGRSEDYEGDSSVSAQSVLVMEALSNWRDQVRSAMLDTGANASLFVTDLEGHLQHSTPSNITIQVADKNSSLRGSEQGTLHTLVLGPEETKPVQHSLQVTTVPNLHRELYSVDEEYCNGFNVLLKRPEYEDGIPQLHKPASNGKPAVTIPFRYNAVEEWFWMDYVPVTSQSDNQVSSCMLREFTAFMSETTSERARDMVDWLNAEQAAEEAKRVYAMDGVTEIFFGQHAEERTIRGVKAGLRARKSKMTETEFHEDHCHMGACPGCKICILVMGCMRRIYRMIDPHEETRPAYLFHMDTITYSHRSSNGNKYETVIKCAASKV